MYQIAIVHDIAQAIIGDITPSDGVPNAENKRAAYSTFILLICSCKFQELWSEYENNASLEANLVKDFDKVEMILQALEYEIGTLSYFYLDLTFLSKPGKRHLGSDLADEGRRTFCSERAICEHP
ncbi:hypothetical protein ACFE04_022274 [Oxalis oulophora]